MKRLRVDSGVISLMTYTTIDRLCEHPQAGATVTSNLRRTLLNRFPFSIIYAIEENVIIVIAVAHYGRRPGYWHSRVER